MVNKHILSITNLCVQIEEKEVISHLSLQLLPGKTYALMGPNGSGKSSLAHTIVDYPGYTITDGSIIFDGKNLADFSIEQRARAGIFLAFQHPPTLPGVRLLTFLHTAHHALTKQQIPVQQFIDTATHAMTQVGLDKTFLERYVNEGFSGGEKKKVELLQCILFKPKLILLDEIDSGLDVEGRHMISTIIEELRAQQPTTTVLIITHYPELIQHIPCETIYIMNRGTIVRHGAPEQVAQQIENFGYTSSK